MQLIRRSLPVVLILALGLLLASCQEKGGGSTQIFPVFGDGTSDESPVIATVGDIKITQKDLDLHLEELVPRVKRRYEGKEGQQLLLKEMVDEVLFVLGAEEKNLITRPEVIQKMNSYHREVMVRAMKSLGIKEGVEPTDEELRAFFQDNRKEFKQMGRVRARHVECLTFEKADEAYQLLKIDGSPANFMKVAAEYSINSKTLAQDAETGWYNKTGIIPFIVNGRVFIDKTFDLEMGLHAPIQVEDRWHVVEILERKLGRTMTYNEAQKIVKDTMLPGYYDGLVKDYLLEARETYPVVRFGKFAPGQGLDAKSIFEKASLVSDPLEKMDFYRMIYTDYPESDKADDALFMCALVSMDTYMDNRTAMRYLNLLIKRYPESDLREDVAFLKKNMYNPDKMNPQSIDDLRKD